MGSPLNQGSGLLPTLLLTDSPFRRSAGLCLGSCREAIL